MARLTSRRPGFSLLELSAALTITLVLAALLCGLLVAQLRLARRVADRARESDAVRTTRFVLEGELRRMQFADVRAASADSVAARVFRGLGIPCAVTDSVRIPVRYRGDRLPDPRKDSLLVVTAVGERSVALLDAAPAGGPGCVAEPGESVLRLRAEHAIADAALLLVFESGNYYLTSRALRYRIGAEGRQPVTAEMFVHPGTRFRQPSEEGIGFTLETVAGRVVDGTARFGRGSGQ